MGHGRRPPPTGLLRNVNRSRTVLANLLLRRAVLGKGNTRSVELLVWYTPDPDCAVFTAGDQCLGVHVLEFGYQAPEIFLVSSDPNMIYIKNE